MALQVLSLPLLRVLLQGLMPLLRLDLYLYLRPMPLYTLLGLLLALLLDMLLLVIMYLYEVLHQQNILEVCWIRRNWY